MEVERFFPSGPPDDGDLVDCPPAPPEGVPNGFVATTDLGYVHLRTEPNLSSHVLLRYPPGCELRIVRACVGEPKIHWRFRDPDPVWYWAEGDFHAGYIASADVRAAPGPRSVPLGTCAGGRQLPARAEITAPLHRRLSGPIEIAAAAPRATQMGFAAYYRDDPEDSESATWHQIGVDQTTNDGVTADWDPRSVPGQSRRAATPISIAAVPCLGLEFPWLDESRTRDYVVANRGGDVARRLGRPDDWLDSAGVVACDNVQR